MASKYQRQTSYRLFVEPQFSIHPPFRAESDLQKLTGVHLRYALLRYERARDEAQQRGPCAISLPTVERPRPRRQDQSSDQLRDENLPAVSYVRVEPAEAREVALAADTQWAVIAAAASRLGLRLTAEFADISYSDVSLDRPALRRLLDYVAGRQVGYCVVASLNRFSDNPKDAADIGRALSEAKVAIVVASDHIGKVT